MDMVEGKELSLKMEDCRDEGSLRKKGLSISHGGEGMVGGI